MVPTTWRCSARPSWYLRTTGRPSGTTGTSFVYGQQPGDRPVAGDWNGNGGDEPGIYRSGEWHLRQSSAPVAPTSKVIQLGAAGEQPLAGRATAATGPNAVGLFRPKAYG